MEMKQSLQQRQSLQLIMTPRLQQALKLLQMPTLELQQVLKQELAANPRARSATLRTARRTGAAPWRLEA